MVRRRDRSTTYSASASPSSLVPGLGPALVAAAQLGAAPVAVRRPVAAVQANVAVRGRLALRGSGALGVAEDERF